MPFQLLKNTLIGVVVGFLSGVVSSAGFSLLIPLMLLLQISDNFKIIIGTVLAISSFPVTFLAVWKYYTDKYVMVYTASYICFVFTIFCFIGAYYVKYFSNDFLQYLSGFIYLFLGVFFILNTRYKIFGFSTKKLDNVWV